MLYLFCVLTFLIGALFGMIFRVWFFRKKIYGGTIVVTKDSGKIVYTLIVNEGPENIENHKDILFKIVAPEKNLNRE